MEELPSQILARLCGARYNPNTDTVRLVADRCDIAVSARSSFYGTPLFGMLACLLL